MAPPFGLLVMADGGPAVIEEAEPYLRDVRGFRETLPHVADEVRRRYAAIGGRSPILERTRAQASALEAVLTRDGLPCPVFVGMRHWHPYIGDALARMAEAGIERAVGLVMAPHNSRMSVDLYFKEVDEAASPVAMAPIRSWHLLPGFVDAVTDRVRSALGRFPRDVRARVPVVFTAHSLPQRILEWNDPYPTELAATVRLVVERLGHPPHRFAYQSAAMTRDPWLGPDVGDVVETLAGVGHRDIVLAPIGFTCEHVEILYDVDIELRQRVRTLGVRLERIEMVNEHPAMMSDLARLVRDTAAAQGWI